MRNKMPPRDLHKENQTSLPVKGMSFTTSYEKNAWKLDVDDGNVAFRALYG